MDSYIGRCKTLKLCSNRKKLPENDWISALPDVILVCVLSLLTTKEAGRTSVLSKRWRQVWAYVPFIIFDGSNILQGLYSEYDDMVPEAEIIRYLRCMDQVMSSHKATTMDEITLRFPLGKDSKDSIDKWVRFAAEKKVKKLKFNFNAYQLIGKKHRYTFSSSSFFNSLTSLQLDYVNVTSEVLEKVIYDCKALEFLSLYRACGLVALKAFAPSLKFLRIQYCFDFRNLEISAPNLVSVDYYGKQLCMPFKSSPKLTKLSFGGFDKPDLMMSPVIHQIEVLKLNIIYIEPFGKVFPNCKNVKTLDVWYAPQCDKDLFLVSSVIKACPLLHKLVIQIADVNAFKKDGEKWEMDREEPWCHHNLKTVEIVGFATFTLEVVRYLIKNFVSLEKLVIDTQPPYESRTPGKCMVNRKIKRAREQAEKLRQSLKPEIKFKIM